MKLNLLNVLIGQSTYQYEPQQLSGEEAGIMAAIFGSFFLVIMAVALVTIIAQWKVYTKAGQPGWAVLIPIYNILVLLDIVGKPKWWFFLLLIPIVNIFIGLYITHLLSLSFGRGIGFTLGLILLGPVFYLILAFGNDTYKGPAGLNIPDGGMDSNMGTATDTETAEA